MSDRILTWYIEGISGDGTRQGPTFTLDEDYGLPGIVKIHATQAPDADDLIVDIKDDGTSIFTKQPRLQKGHTTDWWEEFNFSLSKMEKDSLVSLDVVQSGGAKRLTVQLELNKDE